MKTLEEILQQPTIGEIIKSLKSKTVTVPEWADIEKEYNPTKHKIFTDATVMPDKQVVDENGNVTKIVKSTKIAVALQRLAVKRMAEFTFTLPVVLTTINPDANLDAFNLLLRILKKNKWDSSNKKKCTKICSECEMAVYWYIVDTGTEHNDYGIPTKYKIKMQLFSPANGDNLYPLFDATGDMIAFSRETTITDTDGKATTYFDTWTNTNYSQWAKTNSEWELVQQLPNPIGKIPIVYAYRDEPIWQDADNGIVHEMELLLSRNGEIIAYHASPVLLFTGDIQRAPVKGEANKVFYSPDGNGDAKYVSWAQSPESISFQFNALKQQFFTQLQLPDLSFENIKGLGAISGESRRWLLSDAHLKVGDESAIYYDIIDREISILKAIIGVVFPAYNNIPLDIEAEIRPFTINSERDTIENIITANGGRPVISQKTSIGMAGLVSDIDGELEQMQKEQTASVFEPTE